MDVARSAEAVIDQRLEIRALNLQQVLHKKLLNLSISDISDTLE